MNSVRAKRIAEELRGSFCNGWQIGDYINNGKSAVVCEAKKNDEVAAVKIFDPEIVERYGREVQRERTERECTLIGVNHSNLVAILDGGEWVEKNLFYVVMEFLPWRNMADALADIPEGTALNLIKQLVEAARFLDGRHLCHRDIKPENIAISDDYSTLKLLDFGVIRPIGCSPITDGTNSTNFVGTSRYSPPEFLLRKEEDTPEGWRAVTFYQIGAVLHDLIMREPLFKRFESPPAVLVNAVQYETPDFRGARASHLITDIARACLIKNPRTRLLLISWDSFSPNEHAVLSVDDIKSRIMTRTLTANLPSTLPRRTTPPLTLDEVTKSCALICRAEMVGERSIFPPLELTYFDPRREKSGFILHFSPSASHLLELDLYIAFQVVWLDLEGFVVKVTTGWTEGLGAINHDLLLELPDCEIYGGVFSAESASAPLIESIYKSVEASHQARITRTISNQRQNCL